MLAGLLLGILASSAAQLEAKRALALSRGRALPRSIVLLADHGTAPGREARATARARAFGPVDWLRRGFGHGSSIERYNITCYAAPMLRRRLLAAPALLLAAPLRAQAPLSLVASFSILADIAREVGGERVRIRAILGPDRDAHGFQPRPSDAEALRGARVVVQNGLGFDNWMRRMREAANWQGRVITATTGITPIEMDAHAHGHSHGGGNRRVPDPHAWQDALHVARMAQNIADGLVAADAPGAAPYRERANAYAARMQALDAWVRAQIATVPPERRRVITSHDAFGYFARSYGVEFLAPQGVSTHSEPSAAQVANLIRQIRERQIAAVFMDNVSNPATLARLAAEAGVRIRGRLYADALSRADGPAPNVEAMFRHNLGLLVPAMRGEP